MGETRPTRGIIEAAPSATAVNILEPTSEMIHVEDIARSLSQRCRFGGFTSRFYSVADHCLWCLHMMRQQTDDLRILQAAFFHDAHEAYVGDVPTPLKLALGTVWDEIVERLDQVIIEALGLSIQVEDFGSPAVVAIDRLALSVEAYAFMPARIKEWEGLLIPRDEIPEGTEPLVPGGSRELGTEHYLMVAASLASNTGSQLVAAQQP